MGGVGGQTGCCAGAIVASCVCPSGRPFPGRVRANGSCLVFFGGKERAPLGGTWFDRDVPTFPPRTPVRSVHPESSTEVRRSPGLRGRSRSQVEVRVLCRRRWYRCGPEVVVVHTVPTGASPSLACPARGVRGVRATGTADDRRGVRRGVAPVSPPQGQRRGRRVSSGDSGEPVCGRSPTGSHLGLGQTTEVVKWGSAGRGLGVGDRKEREASRRGHQPSFQVEPTRATLPEARCGTPQGSRLQRSRRGIVTYSLGCPRAPPLDRGSLSLGFRCRHRSYSSHLGPTPCTPSPNPY